MIRVALAALLLTAPAQAAPQTKAAASGPRWESSLNDALLRARSEGKPLLIDMTAPWCYSCYYMEQNVLSKPAFHELAKGLVLLRLDVDQPEGRDLKASRRVSFLPTFLVIGPDGNELGRVVGEATEADFLAQVRELAAPATKGPEDGLVERLASHLRRGDYDDAAALRDSIDPVVRPTLEKRPDWPVLSARLDLKRKPTAEALAAVVEKNTACDLVYDVSDGLKAKPSPAALAPIRVKLEAWAADRVFGAAERRCADFRSGVDALAAVHDAAGDAAAKTALYERAIAFLEGEQARRGLGTDRNTDDTLRYFLSQAGKDDKVQELYPKLVKAYPSDYVYAYRFANWLASKKRETEALPWIEKASKLCYGANRLYVTRLYADLLVKLGDKPKAAAMLKRDIKAHQKAFPQEVKPLQELLAVTNP